MTRYPFLRTPPVWPSAGSMLREVSRWPPDAYGHRDAYAIVHFVRGPRWWRICRRVMRALRLPRSMWA